MDNGLVVCATSVHLVATHNSMPVKHPAKRYLRLGIGSLVAILAFGIGIVGLILIAH